MKVSKPRRLGEVLIEHATRFRINRCTGTAPEGEELRCCLLLQGRCGSVGRLCSRYMDRHRLTGAPGYCAMSDRLSEWLPLGHLLSVCSTFSVSRPQASKCRKDPRDIPASANALIIFRTTATATCRLGDGVQSRSLLSEPRSLSRPFCTRKRSVIVLCFSQVPVLPVALDGQPKMGSYAVLL